MKKLIALSLMALCCATTQAKPDTTDDTSVKQLAKADGFYFMSCPEATIDKKTKKKTVVWHDTENNSWHENIGFVKDIPTISSLESIFPGGIHVSPNNVSYIPAVWQLTEENDETVLHCYFRMPADVVKNMWLASNECVILDKQTGTIYQSRRTVPGDCYGKVFDVKEKEGTVLDFQIFFPKLAEGTKNIVIYGVPNWYMRGMEASLHDNSSTTCSKYGTGGGYDSAPQIHMAHLVSGEQDYNKDNHKSWAVYDEPHLIKPLTDGTLAVWLTPEATYIAEACEMNWKREYFGRGGNEILVDRSGHQYTLKEVLGYPNDHLFWMEGLAGDYFAIVKVFEPLPPRTETVTHIIPEGEPFAAWGANWDGKVENLDIQQLRNNQRLFDYHPRNIVK